MKLLVLGVIALAALSVAADKPATATVMPWWMLVSGTNEHPAQYAKSAPCEVTAVYGWDGPEQRWRMWFPAGVAVPGANDLEYMDQIWAYWVACKEPV